MRRILIVLASLISASCGDNGSPTSPSPTQPPMAVLVGLSGVVSSQAGARLTGATVTIHDGPNAGRSAPTDGNGSYALTGLTAGNGNVGVTAAGFLEDVRGVAINGSNTLNFTLRTVAPWSSSGQGNTVFDMPTYLTRIRVRGVWNGSGTSNFIVRIGGSLVVNEILREMPNRTYEGTHIVRGGQTETTNSSSIAWTMTEDR